MSSIEEIHTARERLAGKVRVTPLLPSASLSELAGAEVRLKLETLQDIGAFKLRGATNKLLSLSEEERARGVVAISSGNHGRGVAYAARALGVRAVICMGSLVPENKVAAIRALGAEVRIVGTSQDEAEIEANRLVEEEGLVPAHPFDDAAVIAGQGTIGLELLDQWPALDTVIVPLSGGGLIGGIALAVKSRKPEARVIGVSMKRGAAMVESLQAGKPIFVEELSTLADALGGGIGLDNRHTFALVRDLVDETLLLDEEEIAAGMRHLFREDQLVAEGAGAVGVSALLTGRLKRVGQRVAVVVSGRNVDMDAFMKVVDETA